MTHEPTRAKTLFLAAAEIADSVERIAYLDQECGDDQQLRQRVEALLRADRGNLGPARDQLDATSAHAPGLPETADQIDSTAQIGVTLSGKYKLVEEIGAGGMGMVFLAQQVEPVKRAVAVKVIKAGMDSQAVLARFDAERQALAMMDHPNIARVLDAGTTAGGRPYFVMELVKGVPITQYCDERRLTTRERLELFVPVCNAIQHAHQKGIIHRDIKPSNVLVALYDDRPVAKVIDFGVAKATGTTLSELSLMTGFGAVVGTPEYMSPEQASLNNLDIDTRSDVYSLGVLLYELLTGATPVDRRSLGQAAIMEILRIVREVDPPRPSDRISTLDTLPSIAANRNTDPTQLSRLMRGELDWVLLKALAKERSRRYETANAFSRDIQRYLADELVEARPPSASYRLRKFIRRHRGQVVAASLLLAALLAGIIGTTAGLLEARRQTRIAQAETRAKERALGEESRQRELAVESERAARAAAERELNAKKQAQAERDYAKAIANFVRDDFLALTSIEGQTRFGEPELDDSLNKDTSLRDLLLRTAEKLDRHTDLAPLIEAELHWMIGVNLRGIGEYEAAIEHLERAVELRRERKAYDEEMLTTLNSLAVAHGAAGNVQRSLELATEAVERSTEALGTEHPLTLAFVENLAKGLQESGEYDQALQLFERVYEHAQANLGDTHPTTLICQVHLGESLQRAGQYDRAIQLLERAYAEMQRRLGDDHPSTMIGANQLGYVNMIVGQYDKSIKLFQQTLPLQQARMGANHPHSLVMEANLAQAQRMAGQAQQAIPLMEHVHQETVSRLGEQHPISVTSMIDLAQGYSDVGQVAQAMPLLKKALKIGRERWGEEYPITLRALTSLAMGYRRTGQVNLAFPLLEKAYQIKVKKYGPNHPETLHSLGNLAGVHWSLDQFDRSVPMFEQVMREYENLFGRNHPKTLNALGNLGVNYVAVGKIGEALPLLEEVFQASKQDSTLSFVAPHLFKLYANLDRRDEALELLPQVLVDLRRMMPPDSPPMAAALAQLSLVLLQLEAFEQSEPLLRECLDIRTRYQPGEWITFNTQSMLGAALLGQENAAEAEPLLVEGYEGMMAIESSIPPQGKPRIVEALDRLIQLATVLEDVERLETWQQERAAYLQDADLPKPLDQ